MKITWFGGTALRVYIGGEIVVIDPEAAAEEVDRRELVAGADRVLQLDDRNRPQVDADAWYPRPAPRAIDGSPPLAILSIGPRTVLIEAPGEPPLLICNAPNLPHLGRWADKAVFVLFGEDGGRLAEAIVERDIARPQPLILAASEAIVDFYFDRLADHLQGRSFTSLEPGLALEV
jgi:hypothetical protein